MLYLSHFQPSSHKQRSYSMRQPSSQKHREHGYPPKAVTPGSRPGGGATTPTSTAGGSITQPEPDIVVNGRGNDSSADSVGSNQRGRVSPHAMTEAERQSMAANPNRAEMPGRRKSYDPVSLCGLYILSY